MGLTRKGLHAMGLTEEQVDSIIEAHSETVDGLKDKLKTAEADANKLAAVQKELDELKAKGDDGYKEKYESEKKAFDEYKKTVTEKEMKAAKEGAARAYFESHNITGQNLEIAMRAAANEINGLELDGENIKDTAVLDALTSGTLAGLAKQTAVVGAPIAHPPKTNTSGNIMSMSEIYARDERGKYKYDAETRQSMIAKNLAQQKG